MDSKKPLNSQDISLASRIAGAVWGQFVGDAFCLGSHWIYDLDELERLFPGGPQGFDPPAEGHYHFGKEPGELTHYGDAALLLLRSLLERDCFDAADFGSRFVAIMECPAYKGYRDHAARETLANYRAFREAHPDAAYSFQEGADDDQPATISRLAPLAARYFRSSDYLLQVERATRVCQNNDRAVVYLKAHAMILRELFLGRPLDDAFKRTGEMMDGEGLLGAEVSGKITEAFSSRTLPVRTATARFGQSCPLASSFPAAVHCALHHADDFGGALKATAAAGGDSAGRAAMVGAWLGASLGVSAIPPGWRKRLKAHAEIENGVGRLMRVE
ncbi:ADP-ribosylglycohydrolase family protein [Oryzomonas sagensis]|uniref:ADP-ribosylglycohydrolase family protein n=1 Tax=Oryzomonas sagensis TaxID=2603857 RepID=A0ABQ6TQF4_9BACT|nr:ADP-ribosylglycohydrolase family protein [Oryzomonas sagensis]KAB0671024.1 ADP-ribosylglycohydrolase family protein [Oryzomonas sagensis]